MKSWDMLEVCDMGRHHLDAKKLAFIRGLLDLRARGFGKMPYLTDAQFQYLISCYDIVISRVYDLDESAVDREYAAKRAIAKSRRLEK